MLLAGTALSMLGIIIYGGPLPWIYRASPRPGGHTVGPLRTFRFGGSQKDPKRNPVEDSFPDHVPVLVLVVISIHEHSRSLCDSLSLGWLCAIHRQCEHEKSQTEQAQQESPSPFAERH